MVKGVGDGSTNMNASELSIGVLSDNYLIKISIFYIRAAQHWTFLTVFLLNT